MMALGPMVMPKSVPPCGTPPYAPLSTVRVTGQRAGLGHGRADGIAWNACADVDDVAGPQQGDGPPPDCSALARRESAKSVR